MFNHPNETVVAALIVLVTAVGGVWVFADAAWHRPGLPAMPAILAARR